MGRKRVVAGSLLALSSIVAACGGGGTPTQAPAASQAPGGATQAPPAATQAPGGATQAPAATSDPFEFISGLEGTFSGTWKNTTFGSTGTASAEITFDRAATTVGIKLTMGGNVFGQPAPAPETLSAVITPGQGATFTSKTFGATTMTGALVGGKVTITISSPDVPSARIKTFTATATLNGSSIDVTYEVTFRDSTPAAQGTGTLTKA